MISFTIPPQGNLNQSHHSRTVGPIYGRELLEGPASETPCYGSSIVIARGSPESRLEPPRALEGWDAVPVAAPLADAAEAARIRRSWTPIRVPGHWQLEDAFVAYEGSSCTGAGSRGGPRSRRGCLLCGSGASITLRASG